MIVIPGIITSATRTSIKCITAVVRCSSCGHEKILKNSSGFGAQDKPLFCDNALKQGSEKQACKRDPYEYQYDKCIYMDQQILKI